MPLDVMGLFFFAYRDFVGDADALLERQGFGRAHHRVLYFVNLKPGMPVADLLDILKITKQSLARVLRQLIDNGYIEQKTGDADRRQRLLFATEKGRSFFEVLSATQTSRIDAAIAALPADGKRTVLQVLRRHGRAGRSPAARSAEAHRRYFQARLEQESTRYFSLRPALPTYAALPRPPGPSIFEPVGAPSAPPSAAAVVPFGDVTFSRSTETEWNRLPSAPPRRSPFAAPACMA